MIQALSVVAVFEGIAILLLLFMMIGGNNRIDTVWRKVHDAQVEISFYRAKYDEAKAEILALKQQRRHLVSRFKLKEPA